MTALPYVLACLALGLTGMLTLAFVLWAAENDTTRDDKPTRSDGLKHTEET